MKQQPDMTTRARKHARAAAMHSKMKGINRSDTGVAFMAEGLCLIFEIEHLPAAKMIQPLLEHAHELLQRGVVDDLAIAKGLTTEEAGVVLMQERAKLEAGDCSAEK